MKPPTAPLAGLLLLAAAAAAEGQAYTDVTASSGIVAGTALAPLGRGACTADLDLDGDQDLLIPEGPGQSIRHFRNDGGMVFTDVTASQPLGTTVSAKACVAADVDNDGDPDVLVVQYNAPDLLFINDGAGNFTEEGASRGLGHPGPGWSAAFGDYNRDGWIDLLIGTYITPLGYAADNRLYRNDGGGMFTDVTGATGLEDANGLNLASLWFDHDDDGWPDMILANDKGGGGIFDPGSVYRNNGNGTFTDLGPTAQAYLYADGMGIDVGDLFNDGAGWDIFVTDSPPDHVLLSWDPGLGVYQDIAAATGMAAAPSPGWGLQFLDVDNDGWQDLYVVHTLTPNALYMNPGSPPPATWNDIAASTGCDQSDIQYCVLVTDFDTDGGMDLLHVLPGQGAALLHHDGSGGNWLKVRTVGTVSNRDGIGARIEVTAGGLTRRQIVRAGAGYLCGPDMRCHFGLGQATSADLRITWPSGVVQTLEGMAANQVLVAEEPRLSLTAPPAAGSATSLELKVQGDGGRPYVAALALTASPGIPLPDGRIVPLTPDPLLFATLQPNPWFWPGTGLLPPGGGPVQIPLAVPAGTSGLSFVAGAVTADPAFPAGIRTIPAPLHVTIP